MSPTQMTGILVIPQVTAAAPAAPAPRTSAQEHTRAEVRELNSQLEMLESSRQSINQQLRQLKAGTPEASMLQDRLLELNARIATLDEMLAAQTRTGGGGGAQIISVPPQIRQIQTGPPEEVYFLGLLLAAAVLLPFSIAYAIRMLKRGANRVSNVTTDIADRLNRMEATIDATALEVERIGEGQRFITRLLTEGEVPPALVASQSPLLEAKDLK